MKTIIGEVLIGALEEGVIRQDQINLMLLKSNPNEQTKSMLNEQTELLLEVLSLCKRVY